MTPDDKYSLLNRETLTQPIQMHLCQKQETFSQFLITFLKFILNFALFQKKDDSHSWFLSEITDSKKRWLDKFLKSLVSEDYSSDNKVNEPKHCFNINDNTFAIFIDHCEGNWVGKNFLGICKILRLTANDKYSLLNRANLTQPNEIHLSQKQ